MGRLCSRPINTLVLVPPAPTTIREKIKQLLCRWFDHAWEKMDYRATSWASALEWRRCKRCGQNVMEESIYY